MGEYHIRGGKKLSGELTVGGGKNAILPILASAVLNGGKCVIHNCPLISDTYVSINMLEAIGCSVRLDGSTMYVDSTTAGQTVLPESLVREMRSSFIFLGGVLGRFHQVKISYPGGCELGARPIDLHIKALKSLGVTVTEKHGFISCVAKKLTGARINLDFPSVGATENIMLTATLAEGETIVSNAAKEPEITDLQNFLNGMGAKISGAGTDTVRIVGVKKLHDVVYTVMPDRIVAGTYLVAAAITGGSIKLNGIVADHIDPILSKLAEAGCEIRLSGNSVELNAPARPRSIEQMRTLPHPGFPTDMQPQLTALLALASGTSIINETVFESRNKHVNELARMGANIILSPDGQTFVIKGVEKLTGTTVESKDLRGGAALILAGLSAEGKTIVTNANFVRRGYEHIERDLSHLGADIEYFE